MLMKYLFSNQTVCSFLIIELVLIDIIEQREIRQNDVIQLIADKIKAITQSDNFRTDY